MAPRGVKGGLGRGFEHLLTLHQKGYHWQMLLLLLLRRWWW